MKTALLLDVHNLYIGINKKYPGKVLNYLKLLESLTTNDYELFQKVAYGRQGEDKAKSFITMLKKNGFEIHFNNTPHNIDMAIKAADIINNSQIECLVLGTNYFEVARIHKYARDKGINTMSLGTNLPDFFGTVSNVWEITEDLLQDKKVKEQTTEN